MRKKDLGADATAVDAESAIVPTPKLSHVAPTPWHLGPYYHTDIMNRNGFVAECRPMQTEYAEANAEFIVRACNSHEDLLAALKLIVEHFGDPLKVARAAIAKAEGR